MNASDANLVPYAVLFVLSILNGLASFAHGWSDCKDSGHGGEEGATSNDGGALGALGATVAANAHSFVHYLAAIVTSTLTSNNYPWVVAGLTIFYLALRVVSILSTLGKIGHAGFILQILGSATLFIIYVLAFVSYSQNTSAFRV